MTAWLLATLIPAAFLAGWLYTARLLFARWRPYTEPLSCRRDYAHSHDYMCYRRPGTMIDSAREAAAGAAMLALLWVLLLPYFSVERLIIAGGKRPEPEELAAKIARLEKELNVRGGAR